MIDAYTLRVLIFEKLKTMLNCGDSKQIVLLQLKVLKERIEDLIKEVEVGNGN